MAATLYRMLTGKHAIEARRLDEWLVAVQSQESPPAITLNSSIPVRVSEALGNALSRDPGSRPQTVRDFMETLGI